MPEDLHYSDNENFAYAAEGEPQISEEEFRAKLLVDFAWFEEWPELHAAAMALLLPEFRSFFARNVDVNRPIKCAPMIINTTTEAPVGKRCGQTNSPQTDTTSWIRRFSDYLRYWH